VDLSPVMIRQLARELRDEGLERTPEHLRNLLLTRFQKPRRALAQILSEEVVFEGFVNLLRFPDTETMPTTEAILSRFRYC
jgi:hypothetical protein